MILAWKNIRRFLWCWSLFCCCCCCCYSFVIFLHSHFLFDIIPHSSVDYCQVFTPILYFQPSPSQSNSRHFHFSTIPLSSYCKCYGFELAFSTHRCFLPHTPSRHFWHIPEYFGTFPTFWHNLLLSRIHWELAAIYLKVAGLHTDPQNTDLAHLFFWFTVIHNILYMLTLYLCMSVLQKFYLWWKLW